jgi:hypothetical protein
MDKKMEEINSQETAPKKNPNEYGGILVEGHLKIFDPETTQVFVQERA